jgi:(1->4)-alpha-D-glucan 1-alpha-D-glucosylmutase
LAQTVLKIASPGIPDFYQGTELQALTLVDPDNRRRVDFEAAAQALQSVEQLACPPRRLLEQDGGTGKLYVIRKLLQFRRDNPQLFALGEYHPLQVDGTRKDHVFAFARSHQGRSCIVIIPRWSAKLMDAANELPLGERVWADTKVQLASMEAAAITELFAGSEVQIESVGSERFVSVAKTLAEFPVAVLCSR